MKRFVVIILLVSLFLFSCSGNSKSDSLNGRASETVPFVAMKASEAPLPGMDGSDVSTAGVSRAERKRILNANIEMRVKDVSAAERELTHRAVAAGGWIVSSSLYMDELTLVVKIPAEKYESFLLNSEALGEIESKSVSSDDVTEYYFDLENRIKNKKLLQGRFREYLKKADSMEDILSVERQLNDVTTEIEQLEGSFKGLNRDIDYSTVTFQLYPPVAETISRNIPSFYKAFSTLGYKILSFLYYLFFGVIYMVVFGIPLVLVLGLIFVLGWGRVGFIRRFFNRLKKKDD